MFKLMKFKDAKAAGLTSAEGLPDDEMVAVVEPVAKPAPVTAPIKGLVEAVKNKGVVDAVERQPEPTVELPADDSGRETTEI